MTVQEQIEKEFNKDNNSYIDLYLILDLLISQKNRNNNDESIEEKFTNSEVISSIISLSNKNSNKFKVDHTTYGSKLNKTIALNVIIENESGVEKFYLIHHIASSGEKNFMLENNKNNIQRRLYLMKNLESTFQIPLKSPLQSNCGRLPCFQFNITSSIKDNLTQVQIGYIKSHDKDEQLNNILSIIGNSITHKQSISETFDLLNIQHDFSSKELKESIIYFFNEEDSIMKHDNILLKIKKNIETANKIKLKI